MRVRRGSCLLLALVACAREEPFQARFAVRGRWPGERVIAYRIEAAGGTLAAPEFERALEAALAQWQATGCAAFHAARAGEEPALVFSWQRGAHGACLPFGADPGVAHAGPVGPGTFVHFDAGRAWGPGLSLQQAALHEIGHVLGLDHSPDEADVMYPEPSPDRAELARGDMAGIHSLYGGGLRARGDVVVTSGGTELVLHSVAPPELTDWTLFDTDGDGDEELVTWRTDAAGQGAMWCYHFAHVLALERTLGPLYGVTAPGLMPTFLITAKSERLLVLHSAHGVPQARIFDAQGVPQNYAGEIPPASATGPASAASRAGDLDGDGIAEMVRRSE